MPTTPTFPGVYIEEVPSGVRPITGVATSIAAFIGFFSRGSTDTAQRILSLAEFETEFGGLRADSLASYAVEQFFANGGQQAWLARTAAGKLEAAALKLLDITGATATFQAAAANPGAWGNNLRLDVDYGTTNPDTMFNLSVSEVVNGSVVATEIFRNLTVTPSDARFAADVVEHESKLIRFAAVTDAPSRPAPTGTISRKFVANLDSVPSGGKLQIEIGTSIAGPIELQDLPKSLGPLAATLQAALSNPALGPAFKKVTVTTAGTLATGAFLHVKAGPDQPSARVVLKGDLADALGLAGDAQVNVGQYRLGADVPGKQQEPVQGHDGSSPGATELTAALRRFDRVDLINLLCIPDTDRLPDQDAFTVASAATQYAAQRRAFYLLDPPNATKVRDEVTEIEAWLDGNGTLRDKNAATYFPRMLIADRLNEFRLRALPPSGTIAGLYARIDAERGVWKAPAGLEASLRGVQQLETTLTDAENGVLNPIAINALRTFRGAGNVCWGARTLAGADQLASEWKYVPVRRLALFLEESLYRGTQFAVFEPNDEPLWAQIRLNVGAFMQTLFLQSAFQGRTPREAYLVKCDRETTTQNDVDHGIVNIVVGFAPLKPAEFVIIKIRQLVGEAQA